MHPPHHWLAVGVVVAWLAGPVPAAAQSPGGAAQPERPPDGLFQRGAAEGGANTERLVLTVGLLGSQDQRTPGDFFGIDREIAGRYGEISSGLSYSKPFRKALWGASASGAWRRQERLTNLFASTYTAGTSLLASVSRKARLSASGSYVASPYYIFNLFPGASEGVDGAATAPEAPNADMAVTARRFRSYGAGTELGRQVGQHGRVAVRGDVRRSAIEDDPGRLFDAQGGADVSRDVGASATMFLAYTFRYGETGVPSGRHLTRVHVGDIGFSYRWQRTRTRRTTLSLSGGPLVMRQVDRNRAGWQGTAGLAHMIGRTWTLNGTYRRGVRFVVGFDDPILSHAGTLSLDGLLGERWRLTASASLATGEVGTVTTDGNGLTTRSVLGTLQYAISRRMAVYGGYVYYGYHFGNDVVVPGSGLRDLSRSGLRLGMSLWLPLYTRLGHAPR